MAVGAKGTYAIQLTGIPGFNQSLMMRKAMLVTARTAALHSVGKLVKKDMKKRSPAYPLHMLKNRKRTWKITGELTKSIDYHLEGGAGHQDLIVGPEKGMTGYKYFPGDVWLALEFGHKLGYYDERPFVRPSISENLAAIRAINFAAYSSATR